MTTGMHNRKRLLPKPPETICTHCGHAIRGREGWVFGAGIGFFHKACWKHRLEVKMVRRA